MTAPIRHGAIGLRAAVPVAVAVLLAAIGPPRAAGAARVGPARAARAAGVADARISTTYVMHGRIVAALRVRGEHRGQPITRRWAFKGVDCAASVCRRLILRRHRGAHHVDRLMLTRTGVGSYVGNGHFTAPLRCRGRRYPRGLVVPYTITVLVRQAVPVEGIVFASQLSAVYANRRRIDHTPCPLGPSHDAAWYVGVAAPLPSPPTAGFQVTTNPSSDTVTFTGRSTRGAGGARIASRVWQFGDPASGPADTATTNPASHTFSAPGVYRVVLTITDANGLTASLTQSVTVPGAPAAALRGSRSGPSPAPR
jgi:PKD domain